MKITKLGHCALIIEEAGKTILTDPGIFTVDAQVSLRNIDIILITHEHGDHMHVESVLEIVKNNPAVKIVTNGSVAKILEQKGLTCEIVGDGQSKTIESLLFEGFGTAHAEIYEDYGLVENTGYFINNKLFYPGDAFTDPGKPVEILAFPVAGPFVLLKNAIDYAKQIHPKICFPVHDGVLKNSGFFLTVIKTFIEKDGIVFVPVETGAVGEF